MPFDSFKKALQDVDSPEHAAMLKHVMDLVAVSRKEMSSNYETWDQHDATFRSRRKVDKEDKAAESKGQPKKMVVPLTFSQVMTFVAFNVMTLTQNKRFFQLEPTGSEDNPLAEPMELILERDLRRNTWQAFLVQFFLDVGIRTLGCAEVCYAEEYRYMRVPQENVIEGAFGESTTETSSEYQQIPVFVGNRVVSISPYRFLPDTRLPLTRYQEGEFCGSEDMWTIGSLKGDSALFNLDKIPKYTEKELTQRKKNSRIVELEIRPEGGTTKPDESGMVKSGPVAVTKMVCDITPAHFEVGEKGNTKTPLGDEKFKVRYIVWVANDKTIIRFEEAYYLHCQFPYIMGQFLPDQHQVLNEGLADVCDSLGALNTWKWNAHITSQKNSVESKYIYDPAGIDPKGFESRSPFIPLRKNASQTGVDRYVKQFVTQDVTQNIAADSDAIENKLEKMTGYGNLMQGQFSQGRRDATQSRAVVQGASARGKTTLSGIWDTAFERLGKQLIANNRQEMDFETFSRILGKSLPTNPDAPLMPNPMTGVPEQAKYTAAELFALFKADPITIATSEDFFVYDGSNPSENAFLAQTLQEMWMTIMSNPEVASVMGYGPAQLRALEEQIYILRGVTPARLPAPTPQPMLGQGQVPPNVAQMPPQGGAVPVQPPAIAPV